MEKTFAIGIPSLNRADLLIPSLEKYVTDFPGVEIHVLDNGWQESLYEFCDKEQRTDYYPFSKNMGVAASWNFLCNIIFEKHKFAIILNDDIYWGKKKAQVDSYLAEHNAHLHTTPIDWCNFILDSDTFNRVGDFDEQFWPAYCEDNDYVYRMKLMGLKPYKNPFLLPEIHRVSQTLEMDDSIATAYVRNKKRYKEKWGGEPDMEVFTKPYNK